MKILLFIYLLCVLIAYCNCQTCPSTDPTWRPAFDGTGVIVSPQISNVVPSLEFTFDNTNLIFAGQYGYNANSLSAGPAGVANSFTMNYEVWGAAMHWLIGKTSMPALKAGQTYTFSFDFKLGQALGSYNKIASVSVGFYDPNDILDITGTSQYFVEPPRPALYKKTITTGNFASSTSFQSNVITLTPTSDIGLSLIGIQITRTSQTGPVVTTMFVSNMKLVIAGRVLSSTAPPANLLTVDSELIDIPKPSQIFDVQDLSNCPYASIDLFHWHDPSIWGGVVPLPATSSNIVLPANKKVLISPCSISQVGVYTKITVPATSELIFADSSMTINVQDIYVQGKLIIGTKSCRYNANINIIFHGSKTTLSTIAPNFGSKGIAVAAGGFISVQGKQYLNSWTKLASTVWSGDNIINVQDNVNWEVGQQVLITTSIFKDEFYPQNEVLTIQAISNKQIQFTTPCKYYHYGQIEYQAEVALLSRRIVFQGDTVTSDSTSFGGHVLVSGEGQFSGLQLIRMGQKNIRGRYPLHFHLANVVTNSYISDCSVVKSFYRGITIHGTSSLLVTKNVAFDIMGHCYYLEDGVEMNNIISFNLAAYIHVIGTPAAGYNQYGQDFIQSSDLDQPADSTSSGFYITNAWNTIIGNSAVGGWCGISYPNLVKPIGSHTSVNMNPSLYPNKEFRGNTAHSSGYYFEFAASIYVGGELLTNSNGLLTYSSGRLSRETFTNGISSSANEAFMQFNNTKVYLSQRGVGMWGDRTEVNGLEAHDSMRPASLFGEAVLNRAIVNGQSGNLLSKSTYNSRQGFQFYDTYVQTILTNVVFRNYIKNRYAANEDQDNKVIISIQFSDEFKPQYISATRNITIQNTAISQFIGHQVLDTGSSRYFNFFDSDGSLTGRNVPTIVGSSNDKWWQKDASCIKATDWNVYVCDKGTHGIANLQFWIPGLISRDEVFDATPANYVGTIALFGSGITDARKTIVTRNAGVTGFSNIGWYFYLTNGTPKYLKLWLSQVSYGEHVFLAVRYPASTTFKVSCEYKYNTQYTFNFTQAVSAAAVKSGNGKTYFFDGTHLFVKLINFVLTGNEYFSRDNVKVNDVYWEFLVHITATNTITPPVGNYFTNLSDILPSSTL